MGQLIAGKKVANCLIFIEAFQFFEIFLSRQILGQNLEFFSSHFQSQFAKSKEKYP